MFRGRAGVTGAQPKKRTLEMRHSDSNLYATTVAMLPGGYAKPYSLCKSTASGVLLSIRTGKYDQSEKADRLAEEVALARSLRKSDRTAYDSYKKTMPCVCWAVSEFNGSASVENITKFSGYVYFDIDKMEYAEAKSLVLKSGLRPYVVRMWKSVGGSGLGGLVWAPWVKSAEDYRLAYAKADELAGGILDPSCKNADRKNVLSWSKEVFNLIDAEELPKPEAKPALRTVQAVKRGPATRIATREESKKGVVKYVPSEKEEKKGVVKYVPVEKRGIDLTEDGVAGAPYSRIERNANGLSECFGTFLLENGMEPMWDDPRNPYVNAYGDAWRGIGASPCSSYSFSILNRLRAPYAAAGPARPSDPSSLSLSVGSENDALRYEEYEDTKNTSYTKRYNSSTCWSLFSESVTEPYLVCPEGVPCVRLYLPAKIRRGHRRDIVRAFAVNYYWKYPERLSLDHLRSLVREMAERIEGTLEDNTIVDIFNFVQGMADSPDGVTPSVTIRKVLFLNGSRIPKEERLKISRIEIGRMQSMSVERMIEEHIASYGGTTKLTRRSISTALGVSESTVKRHWKGRLKELAQARNVELGLYRTKTKSRRGV
jgi:hypothetical protein